MEHLIENAINTIDDDAILNATTNSTALNAEKVDCAYGTVC